MSSNREDGETDIYGDLPNFQFDDAFKKLEQDKAYLQNKVEVLGAKLEEMKKENEKLAAKVKALGKNISCLYKTAQREIERKEKIIADLRKERDDLLFRRGLHDSKPSYTRPSRKQLTPTKKVRNGGIRRILESKAKAEVVQDGSITPSPDEYEKMCSIASGSSEKTKTPFNIKVSLTTEVVHLSDSESNTECPVDVKPEEQVENMKSQVLISNKYSETQESEKRIPTPLCSDEIVNKTGIKESTQQADNPSGTPEVFLGEDKASNAPSNNKTFDDDVRKEIRAAESSPAPLVTKEEGKPSSPSSSTKQIDVTTPKKDKISVHMSSEDCGFGRRRFRRVIKPSLSPVTPVTTAQEERGIKRSLEGTPDAGLASSWRKPQLLAVEVMQADPRAQKRRCMDGSLQSGNHHDDVVRKSEDGCGSASEKSEPINGADSSCRENTGDLLVISYSATKSIDINGVCDPKTRDIVRQGEEIDKCDNFKGQGSNDQKHKRLVNEVLKNYGSSFAVSAFGSSTTNTACSSDPNCPDESGVSPASKPKVIVPRCRSSMEEDCIINKVEENQCGSPPSHLSPTPSCDSDHGRSPLHSPYGSRMMTDDELSSRRSWDRERVSRPSIRNRMERHSGEVVKSSYVRSCSQMERRDPDGRAGRKPSGMRGEKIRRDCERAHVHVEKNGDHERGVGRSRDHNRERSGDGARDRGRSRDRHARGRSREWGRDHERRRSGERGRGCDRDRSRDGERRRSGERGRGCDRERSRDGEGRRSRDAEVRRSRDCDSDKSGGHDKERERSRDEERERENRDRDRLRDSGRSGESDRRESDRFKCVNRDRDSYRRRDTDKVQDLERSRDSDRGRETSRGSKDSDKSSGRSLEGRRLHGCRSKEDSPGRTGGKETHQSKSDGKSSGSKFDLREKLNENNSLTDEGGGKQMNGYKDWDRPTSEDDERNVRWCARKTSTRDVGMIRSPQRSSSQRESRPSTPEWD